MTTRPPDNRSLRPLREQAAPAAEDAPLARLFSQVDALTPLPEISALRIRRNLEREIGARSHRSLPSWVRVAMVSAAALFMLEAVAVAAVAAWPAGRHQLLGALSGRAFPTPSASSGSGAPPQEPTVAPAVASRPAVAAEMPTPEAPAVVPSPPRTARPRAKSAKSAPAPSLPLEPVEAAEDPDVALYTRALDQLNAQHDPGAALETLRAYRLQHPSGLFRNEAAVAEIRADLLLGRNGDALGVLDSLQSHDFAGVPQAPELRLLRAELLTRSGRCSEAGPLLTQSLQAVLSGEARERALYTRASCRARQGDLEGSRSDLRDYLREFPQGRFAASARHLTGQGPAAGE